jgi:hypothetical protein
MNLKRLTDRAKDVVSKRGGTEALKQDAAELRKIARGEGSLTDKAKKAADAIKDPGREGHETARPGAETASRRPQREPAERR